MTEPVILTRGELAEVIPSYQHRWGLTVMLLEDLQTWRFQTSNLYVCCLLSDGTVRHVYWSAVCAPRTRSYEVLLGLQSDSQLV